MFGKKENIGSAIVSESGFDIVVANPPYVRQEQIKELKPQLEAQYSCYTGVADLYVYFYERGLQLLKTGGALAFISSNKYFRSGYGEKLRGFLTDRATLHQVIDFGDAPVFKAIAYPCILILSKQPSDNAKSRVMTWEPGPPIEEFSSIFTSKSFHIAQKELTSDGWRLESPTILRLLEKLRKAGKPLGEYVNGRFYRGVTTGLNEVFVINRATRDSLIKEDKSSDEIIKPFLRGRDVKRWVVESQDLWLIFTRRGIDIKKHPAIYKYLKQSKSKLMPGIEGGRKAGPYEWYEIQDPIAYWQEFSQTKIILGRFMNKATFAFDRDAFFHNDALYMIAGTNEYVVAILNSSTSWWFLSQICTDLQNGYLQAFSENLFQIPMAVTTLDKQLPIIKLANRILTAKHADPSANVSAIEAEINEHVYRLYGLTKDEIKIIEEVTNE